MFLYANCLSAMLRRCNNTPIYEYTYKKIFTRIDFWEWYYRDRPWKPIGKYDGISFELVLANITGLFNIKKHKRAASLLGIIKIKLIFRALSAHRKRIIV